MAIIVMVYGHSGSGKSTSLRNFKKEEVGVINVSGKPLPFRGDIQTYKTDDYGKVDAAMRTSPAKSIVIDDATYLMTNEFMRTAEINNFQKFTVMAKNFWALILAAAALPEEKIIYVMGHIDPDANGNEKFKTIGKLIDEKVTLEGLFVIVLKTAIIDGKYMFQTQTNGNDTAKSPLGMFEEKYIENDLKAVDAVIREYYQMDKVKEEKK